MPAQGDLSVELQRQEGMVKIASYPAGATILVNGQPQSEATPAPLRLPVGKYAISITKPKYAPVNQVLEVKDGAFLGLEFTFDN